MATWASIATSIADIRMHSAYTAITSKKGAKR